MRTRAEEDHWSAGESTRERAKQVQSIEVRGVLGEEYDRYAERWRLRSCFPTTLGAGATTAALPTENADGRVG